MTRTTSVPSISKASDRKMFMMNGRSSSMVSMSEENLHSQKSSSAGSSASTDLYQIIIPSKKTPTLSLVMPVRTSGRAPLALIRSLRLGCLPPYQKASDPEDAKHASLAARSD